MDFVNNGKQKSRCCYAPSLLEHQPRCPLTLPRKFFRTQSVPPPAASGAADYQLPQEEVRSGIFHPFG
jgi:hypothetical protein